MRRWAGPLAIASALALLPLWMARAQAPTPSPHGDLGADCATCHTSEGWTPLRDPLPFEHAGTGFPLRAAHAQAGCRDCHRTLVFHEVGSACADCHADAHRGELGTDCGACHAPESWTNRQEFTRAHGRTRFPLLGAHAILDCEACHRGQQPREFINTPSDCVSCHRADYDGTSSPSHRAAGFSTACQDCHSTSAWRPATFDHERFFPIASGRHAGIACSTCHVNPGSFATFECVGCHEHRRSEMDDEHEDVRGYQYASAACYRCHPRGQE